MLNRLLLSLRDNLQVLAWESTAESSLRDSANAESWQSILLFNSTESLESFMDCVDSVKDSAFFCHFSPPRFCFNFCVNGFAGMRELLTQRTLRALPSQR